MAAHYYNLKDAAKAIGISRRALYKFYLKSYKPDRIGGHPVLTHIQILEIRAERRKRQNGSKKAAKAAA